MRYEYVLSEKELLDYVDDFKESTLSYIRGIISIDEFRERRDEIIKIIKLSPEAEKLRKENKPHLIYVSSGYDFREVTERRFLYDFQIFKNDLINQNLCNGSNLMFNLYVI